MDFIPAPAYPERQLALPDDSGACPHCGDLSLCLEPLPGRLPTAACTVEGLPNRSPAVRLLFHPGQAASRSCGTTLNIHD